MLLKWLDFWKAGAHSCILLTCFWLFTASSCNYQVPWKDAVAGRDEAQIKRRWHLMKKCCPGAWNKGYEAVLEHLVDKYVPGIKQQAGQEAGEGEEGEEEE